MNSREAHSVRRRAVVALTGWTMLTGLLAAIGVVAAIQGLLGRIENPRTAIVMAPAAIWIAAWVWACAWVVWTYRRQVPALVAAEDPYAESWDVASQASRHASVRLDVMALGRLTGVDLQDLRPTPAARFVNGQWVLVGHVTAVGLCVIGAVWA